MENDRCELDDVGENHKGGGSETGYWINSHNIKLS